jgi:chromosome segregation ATPase
LQRDFSAAQEELGFLRQLLEEKSDECGRLTASTTHAQAEIKSFHTERLSLKSEAAAARQRLAALEARLQAVEQERSEFAAALAESEHTRAELAHQLEVNQQRVSGLTSQLEWKEHELQETLAQLAAAQIDQANAHREWEDLHAESGLLRTSLDTANARLATATAAEARLIETEQQLQETDRRLASSEEACRSLAICCEELKRETQTLRHDLENTDAGKELVVLRGKLEATEAEARRAADEARKSHEEILHKTQAQQQIELQLKNLCQQLQDAESRALAASESKVQQDNDVLRGIVERQNSELQSKHIELVRLKRARIALRIVYTAFGLALVILAITAAKIIPQFAL